MAEFARLNFAYLAAGAACGEILRRIWRYDLKFHERMRRENFIFIDRGFASHLVVEFYCSFSRGILFARKGLNFIMKFRIAF